MDHLNEHVPVVEPNAPKEYTLETVLSAAMLPSTVAAALHDIAESAAHVRSNHAKLMALDRTTLHIRQQSLIPDADDIVLLQAAEAYLDLVRTRQTLTTAKQNEMEVHARINQCATAVMQTGDALTADAQSRVEKMEDAFHEAKIHLSKVEDALNAAKTHAKQITWFREKWSILQSMLRPTSSLLETQFMVRLYQMWGLETCCIRGVIHLKCP